ncbi:hypothetical protein K438DRAFT_2064792 [Mycena galopus ATCC 62051]|nr:hypothetical protein K438DRAFT_2064792 [Mycena galopus ATCC 62051]
MSNPSPERKRAFLACVHCRRHKVKCRTDDESGDPCERCIRRGLVCEYVSVRDAQEQVGHVTASHAPEYYSVISRPAPQPTASNVAVKYPPRHLPHLPTCPPNPFQPVVTAPELYRRSAPWGGGQPMPSQYYPHFAPPRGHSGAFRHFPHGLPYSANADFPHESSSSAHPSQRPGLFLTSSDFSQPQEYIDGGLGYCGDTADDNQMISSRSMRK